MTTTYIATHRLQNQHLTHTPFTRASAVASWLGAMQAQDYAHAKWAIGLRLPGATEADVEAAIDRGEIIRTHLLRPTWHFVAPEDVRWMLALSAPQIIRICALPYQRMGLDDAIFRRSQAILVKSLEGGQQRTRAELMAELEQSGIVADSIQAAHLMMRAELDGVVCNGARRGKQFTYALLDEWVPAGKHFDRPDAIAELARRYFASHAPATLHDFQWWSGLNMADARAGLEAAQPFLVSETMDNKTYWTPSAFQARPVAPLTAHLLPAFDEFLVGYTDRDASLDPSRKAHAILSNGIFKPVIAINGKVRGIWQRTFYKQTIILEKQLFNDLSTAENQAFREAAARFANYIGQPYSLLEK